MDINYATGTVKDYEKINKKTGKITIQKSIKSFKNLQYFTDTDTVAIISLKDLELLTTDNALAINNELINAKTKIKELENKISKLSADNISLIEDKDQLNNNLQYLQNKYNADLSELKAYQTKADANEHLIMMMLDLTDSISNEIINNTIKAVTNEHNKELADAGIIKRLKGIKLNEPAINKDDVKAKEITKLKNSINNKLLVR